MKQRKTIITHNFSETQKVGFDFAKTLRGGELVCLYGDLGAGKTTFVQGLAEGLGITKKIISPTFIIVRTYELANKHFYHMDLYRIETENDVESLGLKEIMQDPNNIVVMEWPEKIENMLPKKRQNIFLKYIDDIKREIIFE